MTGERRIFKEWHQERLLCLEYRKELAKHSLVTHRQTQYGVAKGGFGSEEGEADRIDGIEGGTKPRTYRMVFPARARPGTYSVEGCSGWALTRMEMRVKF